MKTVGNIMMNPCPRRDRIDKFNPLALGDLIFHRVKSPVTRREPLGKNDRVAGGNLSVIPCRNIIRNGERPGRRDVQRSGISRPLAKRSLGCGKIAGIKASLGNKDHFKTEKCGGNFRCSVEPAGTVVDIDTHIIG